MKAALTKIATALHKDGIVFMSLKERPIYEEEVKEDQYGKRMFYYYSAEIIKDIAGDAFTSVHEDHQTIGKTDWFTLALRKK